MKMIFVVFSREIDGKRYAVADTIKTGNNLKSIIEGSEANICLLCESRKQAELSAIAWNESYKANGTYLF